MINDIIGQLWDIPRALMLAVLLALAFLFVSENGEKAKDKIAVLLRQRWKVAFLFYLAFILTETIFTRQITNPYQKAFESFIFSKDTKWDKEIIENVLLFIPYSFLYLKSFNPHHPSKSTLLLSAVTTASIEVCQLLFWLGKFQIADIIHNIIGGIIGYMIWSIVSFLKAKLFSTASDRTADGEK